MDSLYDVIVVGAGPAGTATAIQLALNDPAVAKRTLVLDAAVFPREKLCGGGIVRESDRLLGHLGVEVDVPSVPIHAIRFQYEGGSAVHRGANLFRVVQRAEFDHVLLSAAKLRGATVREGERVVRLVRERDCVCVETRSGSYRARIVIGADGTRSVVRSSLVGPDRGERFVALGTLTPWNDGSDDDLNTAVLDFRPVARGLRGYAWDFPSLRSGQRRMNRGLGGSRWPSGVSAGQLFAELLEARGVDPGRFRPLGGSAPLYDPESPQSAERVLLAGDAVGVDPWFGEGISVAIGTGILAAHAASEALAEGRFDFAGYRERVRESAVGWRLTRSRLLAEPFYEAAAKPRSLAPWFGNGGAV
jgi:geranylgeranyl reductase family protein